MTKGTKNTYDRKNDQPCPEMIFLDNAADYPCELKKNHKGMHEARVRDRESRLAIITWRTRLG